MYVHACVHILITIVYFLLIILVPNNSSGSGYAHSETGHVVVHPVPKGIAT